MGRCLEKTKKDVFKQYLLAYWVMGQTILENFPQNQVLESVTETERFVTATKSSLPYSSLID